MNFGNFCRAVEIVAKYAKQTDYLQGEHDIIFFPLMNDAAIDAEDEKELQRLGAHKSSEGDCWATFT